MERELVGAVDIGGTKIHIGLVESTGAILLEKLIPTRPDTQSADGTIHRIFEVLEGFCTKLDVQMHQLAGIGVACAGPVNIEKGVVENPYTLPGWEGYPIVHRLEALTQTVVRIENDANAALLGEVHLNHLEAQNVLMLTFGTGIGVACWQGGRLHRAGEYHPEMGHTIVASYGEECYCRHRGCFESLCSGMALNKRAEALGYSNFDNLFSAAAAGDEKAGTLLNDVRREVKNGVWNLCVVFKPDTVILGGGLMAGYFSFFQKAILEEQLDGSEDFIHAFRVLPANLQVNPALAGAKMLLGGQGNRRIRVR